ncbi:MAG: hypothetical protein QME54_04525 [Actinomycetota bacterium]|nr:hypothetical protein [Actinomycetota bacterium]
MIDWIINNYQWFFSGLGVFLFSIVIGFIIREIAEKVLRTFFSKATPPPPPDLTTAEKPSFSAVSRRQIRKRATIKNIRIGNKTQVNIIQSEGNVQISHPNLKDISRILAELLEGRQPEILKLETGKGKGDL